MALSYDKEGYDEEGYDKDGYNIYGYNKDGYNKRGFNSEGISEETGTKYDKDGYDVTGYNSEGINKETGTKYNKYGYDKDGYNRMGYDVGGFNRSGYNKKGFNRKGINKETGTKYDKLGYDKNGYDEEGYDKEGFNIYGYNKDGYDKKGFNREGINEETGTKYDKAGYDKYGKDSEGYDKEGYNIGGFNREGINKETGTKYNQKGYDKSGYDKDGYDINGFNKSGFNRKRINKETKTKYDKDGYDISGYNEKGYDKKGFNREGISEETGTKYNKAGYDKDGIDVNGINKETGEKDLNVVFAEEFISSKMSIKEFAARKKIPFSEMKVKIERLREIPCIKDDMDRALELNHNRFVGSLKNDKEKLLLGEIDLKDIHNDISKIMKFATQEESEKIRNIFISNVLSHNLSIHQYSDIFGLDRRCYRTLPKQILERIDQYKRFFYEAVDKKDTSIELSKEKRRIQSYSKPYVRGNGETLGFWNESTGKTEMVNITEEHREKAREYLKSRDEYICNKTMQSALREIVRSEIVGIDIDTKARSVTDVTSPNISKSDTKDDSTQQKKERIIKRILELQQRAKAQRQEINKLKGVKEIDGKSNDKNG